MTHDSIGRGLGALTLAVISSLLVVAGVASAQNGPGVWSAPRDMSESPKTITRFPLLFCDAHQNLHLFYVEMDEPDSYIYYRTDSSGEWSKASDILLARTNNSGYLNAVTDLNNIVHLTWLTNRPGGDMYYSQAPLDQLGDARAWTTPVVLVPRVSDGALSMDSHGKLFVSYIQADQDNLNHVGRFMSSEDGGATWSAPVEFFESVTPVASVASARLQVDDQNRYHVNWQERSFEYGAHSRVGYMRSTDEGKTWTKSVLAESSTPPGVDRVEVFLMGNDEVHLTWDQPERLHSFSTDGGNTWSRPRLITDLGWGFGGSNELVKDSNGNLHAVSGVTDGVYHSMWNNGNWDFSELIKKVDNDPHGQDIVTCRGNELHVIYYDRTKEKEVWYSMAQMNGPSTAREPIPTPAAMTISNPVLPENASQASVLEASVSEADSPAPRSIALGSPPRSISSVTAILVAIIPVLLLIGGTFILYRR